MFRGSLFGTTIRAGIYRQASRVYGSGSDRPFHAFLQIPRNVPAFSGSIKNSINETHVKSSILGNLGMKLGPVGLAENVSLPCALSFRSFIHSGEQPRVEAARTPRSMDYVQGLLQESGSVVNGRPSVYQSQVEGGSTSRYIDHVQGLLREGGNGFNGRPLHYQPQVESNADIVHIKLKRNNAFVTLTDSKGRKKIGVSAGQVAAKGDKPGRYSGEAAAENIGRVVRQMKTRSVVVKVNGFTFFRRKKDAILAFKDGYTNSRGDRNPVAYIEDTTRKPHNGCRLPKRRRI